MKKICFVVFDLSVIGGVEQVSVSLANALVGKYKVYIYSINLNHGEKKYCLDSRVSFTSQLSSESRLRNMIRDVFKPFIKFIKENEIDLVFSMENYAGLVVSFTRFFTKAKYIYCDHGALMNQWHRKDIVMIKWWDSFTAHKVVTLTERTKKDFMKKFHIAEKKIQYIYNWIEPYISEERKPYKIESRKILSVGRFGAEKGYDMLVKIATKLLPRMPEWSWDIYGEGATFEEIKNEINAAGIDDQVFLKGSVNEAYKLFSAYAFVVLPSYREGLPLVLLEAKGCGIPMVSFDIISGPREIIQDGQDGFLIPPYDIDMMVEKMQILMNDDILRQRFAKATGQNLDKFKKSYILNQWIELIESM